MRARAYFKFRLYIAGDADNSIQAIANLEALCREHFADRHEIEFVNVLQESKRALAEGILLTPMLVKYSPPPIRKIIGNLSERDKVLQMLELQP